MTKWIGVGMHLVIDFWTAVTFTGNNVSSSQATTCDSFFFFPENHHFYLFIVYPALWGCFFNLMAKEAKLAI